MRVATDLHALAGPEAASVAEAWRSACDVAELLAAAPATLGGVRLCARPGPVRDAWLAELCRAFERSGAGRVVTVPAHCDAERLVGGLDLAATLSVGRPIQLPGLLAMADGGCLVLPGVDRFEPAVLAVIAQAMDGAGAGKPLAVVAIDERGMDGEAGGGGALDDRLAFSLDLEPFSPVAVTRITHSGAEPSNLHPVAMAEVSDSAIASLTAVAATLGIGSTRAVLQALAVARLHAGIAGRAAIDEADLGHAVALVLAHKARCLPQVEDDADQVPEDDDHEPEPPPQQDGESDGEDRNSDVGELAESLVAIARASLPAHLLDSLLQQQRTGVRGPAGRVGAKIAKARRGRPFGVRRGRRASGDRVNVAATIMAAVPLQRLRRPPRHGGRLSIAASDIRLYRNRALSETLTILVVDASGSLAAMRLGEAKGAVEILLGESYVRRDHVALVVVKGREASVVLPPTRSLTRARRELCALPGGGGTPLADGLDRARALAIAACGRGQDPLVVVLTDGGANIARGGSPGRAQATQDAVLAAQAIAQGRFRGLLIDTAQREQPRAKEIAAAMRAQYLPLPRAGAADVGRAVLAAARSRQ